MVRRRARTSKPQQNVANGISVLEDQYYASPKRKDCKVECGVESVTKMGNSKDERNCSKSTNDVPHETRSQANTIETFFKTKTAGSNIKEIELNNESDTEESLPSPPLPCFVPDMKSSEPGKALMHSQNGYIFNLSEDTNDDETEVSDETKSHGRLSEIDYAIAQRSVTLDDSYSSRSSVNTQTDNIFLQEPVLTLNIDKTLNQASSIKINKSIEIEPIFSSPPSSLAACALNGRFNQIVSLNGGLNDMTSPKLNDCFILSPENDNSSCDSGVGLINSLEQNIGNSNINALAVSPFVCGQRRRKPATPHRILCPSPTKAAPRTISHIGRVISPSPGRKKDHLLSPRKSPRHINIAAAVTSKSRRRLNPPQLQESGKPPYKLETTKTAVQNGFEQKNGIIDLCTDAPDHENDDDDDDIEIKTAPKDESEKIKNISQITAQKHETKSSTKFPETKKTAAAAAAAVGKTKQQQQTLPPKTTSSTGTKTKSSTNKNHQLPHPLGSTNNTGNRELTQFFPVRRSVRKTKTVVKEEMMRSLEQAVLEERADGLKVENFEGKGRGVIADRRFQRGEFVVEYIGDLISMTEATEREKQYALDENAGCYMYYFKHKNQQYCIDATMDTGKFGRLVNHSRNGNLCTKVVVVKQRPHLVLLAKDDILPGEELTYDYGDRSKESLLHHPWLAF